MLSVCLPGLDDTELVSVTMIGVVELPVYWLSSVRIEVIIVGMFAASASSPASVGPGGVTLLGFCGYQWMSAKPIWLPSADRTVWFHACGLPADVWPSGQLPGAVSTTPMTMLGSTAFIAEM